VSGIYEFSINLRRENSDNVPEVFEMCIHVVGTGFSNTVRKNFVLEGVKEI
jgi:hypothetical protein